MIFSTVCRRFASRVFCYRCSLLYPLTCGMFEKKCISKSSLFSVIFCQSKRPSPSLNTANSSMLNAMLGVFLISRIRIPNTADALDSCFTNFVDGSSSHVHEHRSMCRQSKCICSRLLLLEWSLSAMYLGLLQ